METSGRKRISRTMIEDTLSQHQEDNIVDVDPCKLPPHSGHHVNMGDEQVHDATSIASFSSDTSINLDYTNSENSAILSLSSVHPRFPAYEQSSLDPQQLSTIHEVPDSPVWLHSSAQRGPVRISVAQQSHDPSNAFELRSPTSIYSRHADDPFVSRCSSIPSLQQTTALRQGGAQQQTQHTQPKSPFVTVLNDPRAQDLTFMQNTGNGWTADLDQYVYSKREAGSSSTRTVIPEYGTILDYAKATRRQKNYVRQHSSVERELAAVGYDKIHAAIERQQLNGRLGYEKSLPSPPVDTFSPEIRARLGLAGTNGGKRPPQRSPQRSETAPSFTSPNPWPKPPVFQPTERLPPSHRSPNFENQELSPQRLSLSPERSPSRLTRLRSRLGRSPERRHNLEAGRRSPERIYIRRDSAENTDSREPRGRTLFRDSDAQLRSPSPENDAARPHLWGTDRNRSSLTDSSTHNAPDRSTTLPVFPAEPMPRASMDKLWGEKGVLARPTQSPGNSVTPKGKRTPLKQMASKIFKSKETPPQYATTTSPNSPESKLVEVERLSKFPISIERGDQMRLFGEIEYMLQTLANDFLLEQLDHGRLSRKSIKEAVEKWSRRGRAQVVDFCFDLRTQLELLQQNLDGVQFHGRDAFDAKRRFVLVYAWKDVARELAVRSFCSADSAVRKMLSDCYVILDMLGAEGAYWLIFQKLHVTTLDKIRAAEEERKKSGSLVSGQTRQVVPGSPVKDEEMEGNLTNRHIFESF